MEKKRNKLPEDLAGLSRDEWVELVRQAGFSPLDRDIIKYYIVLGESQMMAAVSVDRDRTTIYRRMPYIIKRAREIANKLHMI